MSDPTPNHPETTALGWFVRGMTQVASVPAFILMAAFVGFAGLARDSGVAAHEAVMMTAFVWALPAMVVLVGAIQSQASLAATMLAVALSSVRLLPMVVSLIPVLRGERTPKIVLYALSHFVAVTAWVFAMHRLPTLPRHARVPYFAGFAMTLTTSSMIVTAVAHVAAGKLPVVFAAALTLLTPLYFVVSLWGAARVPADKFALVLGMAVWPVFHRFDPDYALIWTGLAGGTLAYGAGRLLKARDGVEPAAASESEAAP